MFQETPIYSRLVAERGDIPIQVRHEAERIHRDLAHVLPPLPAPHPSGPHNTPGSRAPDTALHI
ncbi:hypothetical protein [Streptomyces sp. NPDC013455]|uniref:hypothetical protein n=1 Tax=Streptomyces sp. NPDC013455 TaxID=3155605 RepID=UPI0033D283D5